MSESDVLTVGELCKLLRLGRNSVYTACGRGEIPHKRIGRRLLFSRAAITAWLAAPNADKRRR